LFFDGVKYNIFSESANNDLISVTYYITYLDWGLVFFISICLQMAVHIGNIIKGIVKDKGMPVKAFADNLGFSRRNAYEIFNKTTIDTGLLVKVSKILNKNLFLYYLSDSDLNKIKNDKTTSEELKEILTSIKSEVKRLKEIKKL
jgi:hypothetical protein